MAADTGKIVTIAGTQYRVAQMGARTSNRVTFRGGQVFAQALAEGFSAKGDTTVAVIWALVTRMSMSDYDWLCEEMTKVTSVAVVDPLNPGRPPTWVGLAMNPASAGPGDVSFDEHFKGKQMALIEWLKSALETNFGSFTAELLVRLEEWRAAKAAAAEAAKAASTSAPQPAPMVSGGSGVSSSANA